MPLSPATPREHVHTRAVECKGYRRTDGLWDIEGHMTDRKTYDFDSQFRGSVKAGEPVHNMWMRLTLDDSMTVVAIEAHTDHAPYPNVCPHIAPDYQKIVGLKIGPGWTRAIKERMGGVKGCTHLTELLGPLATTAFQTIYPLRRRTDPAKEPPPVPADRPFPLLNTCHAFAADSEIVRKIAPGHYTGKAPDAEKTPDK